MLPRIQAGSGPLSPPWQCPGLPHWAAHVARVGGQGEKEVLALLPGSSPGHLAATQGIHPNCHSAMGRGDGAGAMGQGQWGRGNVPCHLGEHCHWRSSWVPAQLLPALPGAQGPARLECSGCCWPSTRQLSSRWSLSSWSCRGGLLHRAGRLRDPISARTRNSPERQFPSACHRALAGTEPRARVPAGPRPPHRAGTGARRAVHGLRPFPAPARWVPEALCPARCPHAVWCCWMGP